MINSISKYSDKTTYAKYVNTTKIIYLPYKYTFLVIIINLKKVYFEVYFQANLF